MTDLENNASFMPDDLRTPEMEMSEIGANVPEAHELELADINPANPHLFQEHRWHEHFARLRAEDPVHLNEIETTGRYWSITKHEDVRAIDGNWKDFSSADGVVLGIKLADLPPEPDVPVLSFIAMDPPEHTEHCSFVW